MTAPRILLVEDEAPTRERLERALREAGYAVFASRDGGEALHRLRSTEIDLVVSDHRMPRMSGIDLLRAVRRSGDLPFILYSAARDAGVGFRAGRLGALQFLEYPFEIECDLLPAIERALARVGEEPVAVRGAERIQGRAGPTRRLRALVRQLGRSRASVLITGETGAGKEVVARAIHEESGRAPWITFAVTELADGVLEAELFGHERGAFTGAVRSRPGLFEQAHGGTLLLDEVGDAPPALQAKLLRVLETGEVRRVGGSALRRLDVRLLAATHRSLADEVRAGRFREDLFYRLNQASLRVPPLRERAEDLDTLVAAFLAELATEARIRAPECTPAFLAGLRAQPWPGNARQLRSVLQSALLWWDGEGPLGEADLLETLASLDPSLGSEERVECHRMVEAFRRSGGNQEAARRALGMTRAAWRHRWRRFGLAALGRSTS